MFQNQKYSNCGHCSLLSAFLFRVGGGCKYLHLHFSLRKNLHLQLSCFSFVLVTSAFLFAQKLTSAVIVFSFVLVTSAFSLCATSALIFRVGYICISLCAKTYICSWSSTRILLHPWRCPVSIWRVQSFEEGGGVVTTEFKFEFINGAHRRHGCG